MAFADGRLFVLWVDLATQESSTGYTFPDTTTGTGGLMAAHVYQPGPGPGW